MTQGERTAQGAWRGGWSIVALSGAMAALGCGATPSGAQADKASQASASPGAAVYRRACAGCHGTDGEGIGSAPAVMGKGALPQTSPG
ncbi:MAG TPA: c-type cytochrome, partial [Polyangiaceae bacterium]